jgi:SnoaL-like domain
LSAPRLGALALALSGAIAACGGSSPPPRAVAPVEPAVDGRKAEKDAKGHVIEIYDTINRGKTDSLFSLLSDPIIVFGPRRVDAMTTRADTLVALGKIVDERTKRRMHSSGLAVVASPGGRSAWASDVVSLDGQQLAVTAILSNADDLWAVTAVSVAETPSAREVRAGSARDAVVPIGGASPGKIDPNATGAVERFKRGLLDQQSWGDDLASRSDSIFVGPAAGEVARGKQAVKRVWKARMRANVRAATSGELTAMRTPDGQLAWISVPVTRVADGEDPLPLRIFAIYEADGAAWKLIALHEALALDEPGSGAAFKKIQPPPPEPPKEEPKEPKEPKQTKDAAVQKKPKATKKKKKRARPAD